MKILVTGGAGFIGSNFIIFWLNRHLRDEIVNLDKLTYAGNLDNLREINSKDNYSFIKGDITSYQAVHQAMQGVDWVVHFAAESHVDRSILQPAQFIKTNVLGTHVLLEEALKQKVKRFHHISTDEVFGSLNLEDKSSFSETSVYHPRSPYAASKAASDHLVCSYFHTYKLPITISNCSNNYGPYQYPEKLIPLAITNLIEGKKVPIYGDGLNVRDWLYVEDHCRAIELILEKGEIGKTYCLGGMKKDINNLTIVKKIIAIMGKSEGSLVFVKDRPGHDRKYAIDWSYIHQTLGWQPVDDFDMWLTKTVKWYKNNTSWWMKLKTGKFHQYYQNQYSDL